MVTYINEVPLNEKQLETARKANEFGLNVRWWGRQGEAVERLYVNNNIQIGDLETQVKIYYKFSNPAEVMGAELKVSTIDMLDKDVYKELMKGVRSWLKPLSDYLQVAEYSPKKPDVIIPTVPRKGHTVGDIDDPKFIKSATQYPTASADDIPF